MVFVSVGSQKFPFDRLLKAVDACVENGVVVDPVFAQTGYCTYVPRNFGHRDFVDHDEFSRHLDEASLVVSHGGTGVIVSALKVGKRVISMPRLARFGEHVDDHQVQIVEQFQEAGLIQSCSDAESLAVAYARAKEMEVPLFSSNTDAFVCDLDRYLSEDARERKRFTRWINR